MVRKFHQFISDVNFEMNKVSWPNWDELREPFRIPFDFVEFVIFLLDGEIGGWKRNALIFLISPRY